MRIKSTPLMAAAIACLVGALVTACGNNYDLATEKSGTIALLLPSTTAKRYESADRPYFTERIKRLCASCSVDYRNANESASDQYNHANSALSNGAKVLVLDPVDGNAAKAIVDLARSRKVPVISYDRLASGNPDYYVSFDNEEVGRLQGEALVKAISNNRADQRNVVMINGAPQDPNAALFQKGAREALEDGKAHIVVSFDTPDWSPENARRQMRLAIETLKPHNINAVLAANDTTAGGALLAMNEASMKPIPPMTGQDADVQGLQRILSGEQLVTIYKPIRPQAEAAATLAVQLLRQEVPALAGVRFQSVDGVKSIILQPVAVTRENISSTVIKDKFTNPADICTPDLIEQCKAANIDPAQAPDQ